MSVLKSINKAIEASIEYSIFASRWFQAIIYLGLIVGAGLYTYKFMGELWVIAANIEDLSEVEMMLGVLGLIDISMVMNLLIIVIVGGYTIFTSKIDFSQTEDRPQWLDHIDADRLKVKLSTSLASISGVHLLKSFIDVHTEVKAGEFKTIMFEIVIHLLFIFSALLLAWIVMILGTKAESINKSDLLR
jgi:uncharacterized protein (TIGR00645 family)